MLRRISTWPGGLGAVTMPLLPKVIDRVDVVPITTRQAVSVELYTLILKVTWKLKRQNSPGGLGKETAGELNYCFSKLTSKLQ